jgi:hypothetical protein
LIQKGPKKSSQQKGFFTLGAFTCKSVKTGAAIFSPLHPIICRPFMRKFAMPCQRLLPPSFCPISAEAFLLTDIFILFSSKAPARQKSGPGVWLAAWKLFSDLILFTYYLFYWCSLSRCTSVLVTFSSKEKVTRPPRP